MPSGKKIQTIHKREFQRSRIFKLTLPFHFVSGRTLCQCDDTVIPNISKKTMKTPVRLRHWLAALLPAVLVCPSLSAATDPQEVRMIVKLKPGMQENTFQGMMRVRGGREKGGISKLNARVISVPAATAALLKGEMSRHSDVEYVEPDYVATTLATTNDPYFTQGSQWHLAKIQAPSAWDLSTGSSTLKVAVVDSGVNAAHPDLAGKVLAGYDFFANDSDPTDENGHGTAVAGVISPAANNALGVAGVTWNCPILPVRVLGADGSGSYSAIANGIIYAADQGARIINLSLGGTASSTTLQSAINYAWSKNCIIVAAAGNNGNNVAFYPAACTNVVAVSATDASDVKATWSNYGSYVDVAAPGVNIMTLFGTDQYATWNGTSFASPVTSGVVALMASSNPALSNSQIVGLLTANSDDVGTAGYDVNTGYGRVNAYRAVLAAKSQTSTADTIAPVTKITSPADGSTVKTPSQKVAVSATDNVKVTKVALYADGVLVGSSNTASATFTWSTSKISTGSHQLQAYGYDAAGNIGASAVITVRR